MTGSVRLRTTKSKREWALWVRDENVADPIGNVANEPAAEMHIRSGWGVKP
jgi:hypothetical protein